MENVAQGDFKYNFTDYTETELDLVIGTDEKAIGWLYSRPFEVAESNAKLICDAFNTHNATGYTPSELKQQKDELLEALKNLVIEDEDCEHVSFQTAWETAKELITKHSNNDNT